MLGILDIQSSNEPGVWDCTSAHRIRSLGRSTSDSLLKGTSGLGSVRAFARVLNDAFDGADILRIRFSGRASGSR